mmetsp:Transcript_19997/g.52206  ORF Transcript_19997/g.52206 Transcript_19997/m.52206 type:complete len:322 (+) Transcript_19997:108-1073(+)
MRASPLLPCPVLAPSYPCHGVGGLSRQCRPWQPRADLPSIASWHLQRVQGRAALCHPTLHPCQSEGFETPLTIWADHPQLAETLPDEGVGGLLLLRAGALLVCPLPEGACHLRQHLSRQRARPLQLQHVLTPHRTPIRRAPPALRCQRLQAAPHHRGQVVRAVQAFGQQDGTRVLVRLHGRCGPQRPLPLAALQQRGLRRLPQLHRQQLRLPAAARRRLAVRRALVHLRRLDQGAHDVQQPARAGPAPEWGWIQKPELVHGLPLQRGRNLAAHAEVRVHQLQRAAVRRPARLQRGEDGQPEGAPIWGGLPVAARVSVQQQL